MAYLSERGSKLHASVQKSNRAVVETHEHTNRSVLGTHEASMSVINHGFDLIEVGAKEDTTLLKSALFEDAPGDASDDASDDAPDDASN